MSGQVFLTGLKSIIAVVLTAAMLFSANPAPVASEGPDSLASSQGLSAGAAWDLRYGNGEVAGDYMGIWTVANCSAAALYEAPDQTSNAIMEISKWEDVEAYYFDSEWFFCAYVGRRGYILRRFLTDRPGKYVDYPGNAD